MRIFAAYLVSLVAAPFAALVATLGVAKLRGRFVFLRDDRPRGFVLASREDLGVAGLVWQVTLAAIRSVAAMAVCCAIFGLLHVRTTWLLVAAVTAILAMSDALLLKVARFLPRLSARWPADQASAGEEGQGIAVVDRMLQLRVVSGVLASLVAGAVCMGIGT